MEAVIQLRTDVARLAQQGAGAQPLSAELAETKQRLDDALTRLGVSLRPMHPGIQDTDMARYFLLSAAPEAVTEEKLVILRDLPAVTGAYLKEEPEPA